MSEGDGSYARGAIHDAGIPLGLDYGEPDRSPLKAG